MYKVDNAIIMAAGMSSRFVPLSWERHKGLLTVKGEILIERQIRQIHEAGIKDITVVVGYRKEDFEYLRKDFGVDIVVNDDYSKYNNPSSLLRVEDRLHNTYICSCDNYFTENVFETTVPKAYYAASFLRGKTNEWGLLTDDTGRIIGVDHAPEDMWCMMGHVFFDETFSHTFSQILNRNRNNPATLSRLWEYILEDNLDVLDMCIRKYPEGVVREFDSLEELRDFDSMYIDHSGSRVMEFLSKRIGCPESEIRSIMPLGSGLRQGFRFSVEGRLFLYIQDEAGDGTIEEVLK
jgi:CTP:phosphocholine cytidylyltransferase-like protein